jgi:hypothetical protein
MKRILLTLAVASGASVAAAAPAVTFSQRPVMLTIKPDFTRPGGQPGAAREIAPAKPVQRRRGKAQPER